MVSQSHGVEDGMTSLDPVSRRYSSQEEMNRYPHLRPPPSRGEHTRKVEPFTQRLDRHDRPCVDRITSTVSLVRPLRNKISPAVNLHTSPCRTEVDNSKKSNPSQYEWRVRERPRSPLNPTEGQDHVARSPSTPAHPPPPTLGRNLHDCDFPRPIAIPTTEEVLSKLREVTV